MNKLFKIENYWRNIDKQILISFLALFILGVFFSFSSTSFLADERLNKGYYFLHIGDVVSPVLLID